MNFERMRTLLLEQAIQGKLVPQLESEPKVDQIDELLKDVPFTIPEKWKWTSLGAVSKRIHYGYTTSAKEKGNARLLRITDIQNGMVNWASVPYCFLENKEIAKFRLAAGDLVIARTGGTIGKSFLITEKLDEIAVFASYLIRVIPDKLKVNPGYLLRFLDSPCYWKQLSDNSRGTGQPNVNARALSEIKVPLPPIEEQNRIVEQVNKLFDLIDCTEKAYNELSGPLSERFRQLCLEKAIQGKLVPQLESEPAVEQIGKLIDTKPFPIPYKWKWAQLKNVTTKITDGTHHSPPSTDKGDFLYITAKNIKSNGIDLTNVTYVSEDIHEEIFKRCNPELGDVLFIKDGATTGVVTINNLENPFSLLSSVALLKVKREFLLPEFLVYVLRSQYTRDIVARQMQGTGIPRVTLKKLKELWIPIPPLDEQHRISQKLQNLITAISLF